MIRWYDKTVNFNVTSCVDLREKGFTQSGIYSLTSPLMLDVYCDQNTDGGGWLVIQRRQDGTEDFLRPWSDYQEGFGDIKHEFWIGNDDLHLLTGLKQELRVDLMDFEGNTAYAKYSSFTVGAASENYKLTVDGYSGTANDSFSNLSGNKFSTVDRDNDGSSHDCAKKLKGAWWYHYCGSSFDSYSNLNGIYNTSDITTSKGSYWYFWKEGYETLKRIEMKIRPLP